jgi:hypothetical protein
VNSAGAEQASSPPVETLRRVSVRTPAQTWIVNAEAVQIGGDLLVYLWGGERPHIGAVAAAAARPSLTGDGSTSATASVIAYPGHKEDQAVKTVAETLSAHLKTNVVVTAGLHWDRFPPEAIPVVLERCREIAQLLLSALAD